MLSDNTSPAMIEAYIRDCQIDLIKTIFGVKFGETFQTVPTSFDEDIWIQVDWLIFEVIVNDRLKT